MPRPEPVLIYVTFPDLDSARLVANSLVKANLAAGVNICGPGISIYHWQGNIKERPEWHFFAQTIAANIQSIAAAIQEQHPYETPCLVVLPITDGNPAFLQWICENSREKPCGRQ